MQTCQKSLLFLLTSCYLTFCIGPVYDISSSESDLVGRNKGVLAALCDYVILFGNNSPTSDLSDINCKCSSHPCRNGATCVERANGYRCTCVRGYTGDNCERSKYICDNKNAFLGPVHTSD